MPYDVLKARKAIETARAYERLPGSEFVMQMAALLKDADEEIRGAGEKIRLAETETLRSKRDADQLREDYRALREDAAKNYEHLLLAMKDIAASGKGGKGKAIAALMAIGVQVAVEAKVEKAAP